jgi:hypothetical protein
MDLGGGEGGALIGGFGISGAVIGGSGVGSAIIGGASRLVVDGMLSWRAASQLYNDVFSTIKLLVRSPLLAARPLSKLA